LVEIREWWAEGFKWGCREGQKVEAVEKKKCGGFDTVGYRDRDGNGDANEYVW